MTPNPHLSSEEFEALRRLDTCTVSNAIESFNVRLKNEGFVNGSVHCRFPNQPPMLGYAVTGRIRSSSPPMAGLCYYDRIDWWRHVLTVPTPRVMVIQDVDRLPGIGAFIGEMHAEIGLALKCIGCVTNGAVRDLDAMQRRGFHAFAGSVAVSHAYAHLFEFGEPVEIGGLRIRSGDLVHGDQHGVQTIPMAIAAQIPAAAELVLEEEGAVINLCRSPDFTLEKLAEKLSRQG